MDISVNRLITEGNLVWKIPHFFLKGSLIVKSVSKPKNYIS